MCNSHIARLLKNKQKKSGKKVLQIEKYCLTLHSSIRDMTLDCLVV